VYGTVPVRYDHTVCTRKMSLFQPFLLLSSWKPVKRRAAFWRVFSSNKRQRLWDDLLDCFFRRLG
jgi:hypothetical protein